MGVIKLNTLTHFVLRTGMWVPKPAKDTVTAFINGYEAGSSDEFKLSVEIKNYLERKLDITGSAMGWPYQIEQFSAKNGINWISGFKRISIDILADNVEQGEDFDKAIREYVERILERLENYEDFSNSTYLDNWLGIVCCENDWFVKLWNKSQMDLIIEMNEEIKGIKLSPETGKSSFNNLLCLKHEYEKLKNYNGRKF